jgi:hypothetical protein
MLAGPFNFVFLEIGYEVIFIMKLISICLGFVSTVQVSWSGTNLNRNYTKLFLGENAIYLGGEGELIKLNLTEDYKLVDLQTRSGSYN